MRAVPPTRRRAASACGLMLLIAAGVGWATRDPWPVRATIEASELGWRSLGFTPDGRADRTHGRDGVRAWDPATGRRVAGTMAAPVLQPVRSPDGKHFAGTIDGGPYHLDEVAWGDFDSGTIRGRFDCPVVQFSAVRWADDGRTFRVVGVDPEGTDCATWSWDIESGRAAVRPILGPHHPLGGQHIAADGAEDGRTLAYHGRDGSIRLWDAEADRALGVIPPAEARDPAASPIAAFSPDGRTLVLALPDGAVEAWDVTPPRRVGVVRFPPDRYSLSNLRVAPDGRTLALVATTVGPTWAERAWDRLQTWLDPRSVRARVDVVVVDLAAGRVLARAAGEADPEFSPDGRWIATGGDLHQPTRVRAAPRPAGP